MFNQPEPEDARRRDAPVNTQSARSVLGCSKSANTMKTGSPLRKPYKPQALKSNPHRDLQPLRRQVMPSL